MFQPKPNRTEPHTQMRASRRGSLMLHTRDVRVLKCCVRIGPRILTTDPHPHSPHRLPAAAVCPIHLSLAGWVTEEQLTAAAAEHGHGVTEIEHVRQHYTIASAHCAQWGSLPSAELELMIHVSPRLRTFGREPSADLKNSCGSAFAAAARTHTSATDCCGRRRSESHAGMVIINATTVI